MKVIYQIIPTLFIIIWSYLFITLSPPQYIANILWGDKVYLKNRLILLQKERLIKLVYFDKDKNKLELSYNVDIWKDNKPTVIDKWKYNFFNFFSYNGKLLYIDLVKKDSKNIEKEFAENLDRNGYVGYYDKDSNNLYIFAHNWTKWVNGGRIFYQMNKGEELKFTNSMLNSSMESVIDDRQILPKMKFINSFINWKWIFWQRNKIFMITCYPNYSSTKRLILVMNKKQ